MGEGMSGGRVCGSGGTGYAPWVGQQDSSGSGCVWVWLPTSGICRLATWGWVVIVQESILGDGGW